MFPQHEQTMPQCPKADLFRPDDPEIQKNPYPFYPVLREERPVLKTDMQGSPCWVLSRRADIVKVLMDPGTFSSRTVPMDNVLFADPPQHERLRNMISRMFTSAAVAPLAARIEESAEALLKPLLTQGSCDIIGAFASPLTVEMIAQMLGIPTKDVQKLREWTRMFAEVALARQLGRNASPEAQAAVDQRTRFMEGLLTSRSYEPDGVVAVLADLHANSELTTDEFTAYVALLFIAGHSTTTNWIGNAVYMLATRPDDLQRLRGDESLIPPYLEEVLRIRPSFHRVTRVTTRDVELGGEAIPKGSILRLLLASANRDAEFFAEPETFDPGQKRRLHSSFGQGIHTCLGSWLARLEAGTALKVFARRVAAVALDAEHQPELLSGGTFNDFGFDRLPVVLTARA